MKSQIQILQSRLDSVTFDENGQPISISEEDYSKIVEEIEQLEEQENYNSLSNPNEDIDNDTEYRNEREANFQNAWK